MSLADWGEKRYGKGVAKAMLRSYNIIKNSGEIGSEVTILKKALSKRPSKTAERLLNDSSFWRDEENHNLTAVTIALVTSEYRISRQRNNFIPLSAETIQNLVSGISDVLEG